MLFIRLAIVEVARKLFDRYRIATYAEFGEDRILHYYLKGKPAGTVFYVDIGCNQPFKRSNTMAFYQRGARGLAIDGNPACTAAYARVRPRDTAVTACVSDEVGTGVFQVADDDAISQIVEETLNNTSSSCREVSFVRAADLFADNNVPESFDILSVDVEGHDFSALKSCDLHRYRPSIIVVELEVGEKMSAVFESDLLVYLEGLGYRLAGYVTRNAYFIDIGPDGSTSDAQEQNLAGQHA